MKIWFLIEPNGDIWPKYSTSILMPCKFTLLTVREESILQDIQPHDLHVKIQDPNFLEEAQLIDVREPEEVYAHILFNFNSFS